MKFSTGMLYHTMSARTGRLAAEIKPPDAIRLLMCWAMLGIAAGTLLCRTKPLLAERILLTQGLAVTTEPRTLWTVCCTALCPMLFLLAGIWLSGCMAFGQVIAMALLFSRGAAFGIAAADAMADRPLRDGLCIAAVLVFPYAFCSILLLCHAVRGAMQLSRRMTHFLLRGSAEPEPARTDRITAMLGILLLTLLAAGAHTVLLWLLSDSLLL